jgi:uncharacterized protein YndB with AHSA1/START domain
MERETINANSTIKAPAEAIFSVLADPTSHSAIDGTGWVRRPIDEPRLIASGQVFRMAMYHPNHPDGDYEIANRVQVLDPPHVISWEPGYDDGNGNLRFGGWVWRYDLESLGRSETRVTLTYDWSAVSEEVRQRINFPPFPLEHLDNSLAHLAQLVRLTDRKVADAVQDDNDN